MSILRVFCVLLAACSLSVLSAQSMRWKVGLELPSLRLPTITGSRTIDLADFRGKKLLLIEFASW